MNGSDARRTTAVALAGEPAAWRATVRDLLRHLRAASPTREAAVEWLAAETPADAEAAAAQLEFLEAVDVVADGERPEPGPYGREFLDTHDEAVLYEALTASVAGFEPLLEALAVRPLTDVEFADLLEREFETELASPDDALAHRQWLQALGYATHDDGVNELTRAGRRRVELDDDLTPPRSRTAGSAEGAGPDTEPGPGDEAPESSGAPGADVGAEPPADADAGPSDEDDASAAAPAPDEGDGNENDEFADLKRRYDHTCAVCGDRRQRTPEEGYARVYRPMPTGDGHGGPADPENAVVVCPNHHADFAHGLLTVDPRTLEIEHAYEPAVDGRTLATVEGHEPGAEYLAYHGQVVADF